MHQFVKKIKRVLVIVIKYWLKTLIITHLKVIRNVEYLKSSNSTLFSISNWTLFNKNPDIWVEWASLLYIPGDE